MVLILAGGIFLFTSACSSTNYYNRYPKEKECKLPDKGAKKARKK
ncbi:MAG: hypothetical protein ABIK52_08810 [Bacteroidota bacterium]